MKRIYLISLFLLTVTFMSCDDDHDVESAPISPDTIAPKLTINSPTANDSVLVIDKLAVYAKITDDRIIDKVRIVLIQPGGSSWVLSDTKINGYRDYDLATRLHIPKHAGTGTYTVIVEVEDRWQNVAKDSVTVILHASDINIATFEKPFVNALLNSHFSHYLNLVGYNAWDAGYSFDNTYFDFAMYLIVNTDIKSSISEAEWDKFITDFDVEDQTWTEWDENRDGSLNDIEFQKGISSLNFFNDWDKNRSEKVDFDEMAAGIFSRWDTNKDNLLSSEEYQEKFYTYLYRE